MTVQEIYAILYRRRFNISTEKEVQSEIEQVLNAAAVIFKREVYLDERNSIDFMIGTVGIEVKIKGGKSDIYRQLKRYAEFDEVKELILVTSKTFGVPATINNKPVYVVNMSKAWL